jgi:hypothetical protein
MQKAEKPAFRRNFFWRNTGFGCVLRPNYT